MESLISKSLLASDFNKGTYIVHIAVLSSGSCTTQMLSVQDTRET